jgi:hypothetical protein
MITEKLALVYYTGARKEAMMQHLIANEPTQHEGYRCQWLTDRSSIRTQCERSATRRVITDLEYAHYCDEHAEEFIEKYTDQERAE